ncbi:MAG TPA: M28 family metallopeptidase [Rhizomicrobium sp.]|nr:M28 family metallopeptidase [Rhizomicrobium sp.]
MPAAALKLALAAKLLIGVPAVDGWPWHPPTSAEIDAHDVLARDRALSHDVYKGRMPGTNEGEHAAKWIADEMKLEGLDAGNHRSFYQIVPGVNITLDNAASSLSFATPEGALVPKRPDDAVFWTPRFETKDVTVANVPLVFVGYGVVAPEFYWNDYAGANVKGKCVVILVNDPGNEDANPDPQFFSGKAMSYYGRWIYKMEEAARHGAACAIIVHESGPAGYNWNVVENFGNVRSWLASDDGNKRMVPIQGWITRDTAIELFKRAGLDYLAMKRAANRPGFRAVPMTGETLSAHAHSTSIHFETRNVVGIIKGSLHPDEIVLFTAHWDHLGMKPDAKSHDRIFNGAVDNALGVSSILELGEAFAAEDPPPARSIAIVAFTMEEQNELGSQYFVAHAPWPLDHIVGAVNLDACLPEGRSHDLVLYGKGANQLEDILAKVLATQGRVLAPDPDPGSGFYYRSDQLSFAKAGIPVLAPMGGYDLIDGGTAAGKAIRDDYFTHRYHQVSDEFNENWDLSGPVEDLKAYYEFANILANSDQWPNWYEGNEFRAARDKSMKE